MGLGRFEGQTTLSDFQSLMLRLLNPDTRIDPSVQKPLEIHFELK